MSIDAPMNSDNSGGERHDNDQLLKLKQRDSAEVDDKSVEMIEVRSNCRLSIADEEKRRFRDVDQESVWNRCRFRSK